MSTTAQCHSGLPLSHAVQPAATMVGLHLPPQPYQPKMNYPKQVFGKQQRSLSMAWYEQYPWIHYLPENDSVLCYYCAKSVQLRMPLSGYVDKTFTEIGFRNWQKALAKFRKHEQTACHSNAVFMVSNYSAGSGIDDMLCTSLAKMTIVVL